MFPFSFVIVAIWGYFKVDNMPNEDHENLYFYICKHELEL
ncbi:hypothetical protein SAMN02745724_05108 [Pseudoalteromonas denitrificans DSM 6059]|uniref:Uncharacterized protein n=1 Tax=Pseudoalteromonas denitrificans DSM 6059 TaxID=1123010 RepID=A0A1I1U499_9GAMM|nr:hypothetical protein SAMN02745724_05108 [Pseudoalteromonas denitrificans DSM 6059]